MKLKKNLMSAVGHRRGLKTRETCLIKENKRQRNGVILVFYVNIRCENNKISEELV